MYSHSASLPTRPYPLQLRFTFFPALSFGIHFSTTYFFQAAADNIFGRSATSAAPGFAFKRGP